MMEQLERAALRVIAEHSGDDEEIIRSQIAVAEIVERDFSGAGFFSRFRIPDNVRRLSPRRTVAASAGATFAGGEHGMGIILFVTPDGKIDFLEGFTYGEYWDPSYLPALAVAHETVTCLQTS
jgi:hypothetical protein